MKSGLRSFASVAALAVIELSHCSVPVTSFAPSCRMLSSASFRQGWMASPSTPTVTELRASPSTHAAALPDRVRKDWIERSMEYYSKVTRLERRQQLGQVKDDVDLNLSSEYLDLAKKHYFALRKIKEGKPQHAETIYRRIISELASDDDQCDHAKLAVTTLLLALLLQRLGDAKKTRSVFLRFFRIAVAANDEPDTECACSAKVLQAYALFEMKQGNPLKSLELVHKAVRLDPTLEPVLNWKQFRDVQQRQSEQLQL